ncbi:hypothetical protein SMA50_26105, partial [Escherichia coli]
AAEPQTGRREVSALTDARKTLAYDFFRILRAPLNNTENAGSGENLLFPVSGVGQLSNAKASVMYQ